MLPQAMRLSFDQYDALLASHVEKMSDPANRPDIKTMNFERARAFEDLKNRFNPVLMSLKKGSRDFSDIVQDCQERIESILRQDRFLTQKMIDYQKELKHCKQNMNKSKRVLRGYGGNAF